ncbi:MAG TPA: HAD-IA family hydrolase [Planctomycetota bacterium]|nr:HAD-IA family hydrolase [Planctomycetota bacterium]
MSPRPNPARPVRAVFFDAGNTLFREHPMRWEIYASVAREFGMRFDADRMRAEMIRAHAALPIRVDGSFRYTNGWFRAYVAEVFRPLGAAEAELPAIAERLFATFRDRRSFFVFPEVDEVTRALRARGLVLAVISNWSPRLPRLLEDLSLADRFDFTLCSAIEEVEKPDPEIFARALARGGVEPAEAVHVGDSAEKDVAGALAAGIAPALLDREGPRGLEGDMADPETDATPETDGRVAHVRDLRGLLPLVEGRLR